jgi:hypothetical protein
VALFVQCLRNIYLQPKFNHVHMLQVVQIVLKLYVKILVLLHHYHSVKLNLKVVGIIQINATLFKQLVISIMLIQIKHYPLD